jgi:hypothetical protein
MEAQTRATTEQEIGLCAFIPRSLRRLSWFCSSLLRRWQMLLKPAQQGPKAHQSGLTMRIICKLAGARLQRIPLAPGSKATPTATPITYINPISNRLASTPLLTLRDTNARQNTGDKVQPRRADLMGRRVRQRRILLRRDGVPMARPNDLFGIAEIASGVCQRLAAVPFSRRRMRAGISRGQRRVS